MKHVAVLALALVLCLGLFARSACAFDPFEVSDIRVEGIQRTDAGTVFSYLPIKVGDSVDEARASEAIKALFATGFFKDVRLEKSGNVLVIVVQERPAIAQVDVSGSKEFPADQLKEAIQQIGLKESRIFDRALLNIAEQELKNQYIARGKYGVKIVTTVTPLERNRVAISFTIFEGKVAKIRQFNFVGNHLFDDETLMAEFSLTTPGLMTWYTDSDQYSKPKLQADLEALRSFYLDRGYIEFNIDSTQVSISPDKENIYITVNMTEGEKYTVKSMLFAGDLIVPREELEALNQVEVGAVFSREKLAETTKLISDRLGDEGYAFAAVNAVPELDRETNEVALTLYIDPGRRVYVRRIIISGNTDTRDAVIRRELRQFESAWYSTKKLNRSRQRVDKLGYFSDVQIDTPTVPGTADQVDVNVRVTERNTGNLTFGIGYSTTEKIVLTAGLSQNNIFGTGNSLSFDINTGSVNQTYSIAYTNPYYTADGVSRGFDFYRRDLDSTSLDVAPFNTKTTGLGIRFGVPFTEFDRINYGFAFEKTDIGLFSNSPQRYIDFVDEYGDITDAWPVTASWARDKRDSVIYTTDGTLQRLGAEVSVPLGDLTYYRLTYTLQWYYPLSKRVTFLTQTRLGVGDGYDNQGLPFYKNFFAGGVNTVRGYSAGSLGPKDTEGNSLGGELQVINTFEALFPFPGLGKDKSIRVSTFLDMGMVGNDYDYVFQEMRFSTGLSFNWFSPVGPLKVVVAYPLNRQPGDEIERFQFTFGSTF
jgi:outer membrane protein insertion porin family